MPTQVIKPTKKLEQAVNLVADSITEIRINTTNNGSCGVDVMVGSEKLYTLAARHDGSEGQMQVQIDGKGLFAEYIDGKATGKTFNGPFSYATSFYRGQGRTIKTILKRIA